jgi:hypothetical protein
LSVLAWLYDDTAGAAVKRKNFQTDPVPVMLYQRLLRRREIALARLLDLAEKHPRKAS